MFVLCVVLSVCVCLLVVCVACVCVCLLCLGLLCACSLRCVLLVFVVGGVLLCVCYVSVRVVLTI